MPLAPTALPLVLDTNVVLDWLVFRDPSSRPVDAAIRSGQMRWCVTAAIRLETERVLTFKHFASHAVDPVAVFSTWETLAETIESFAAPLAHPLRCSDPDDQKFIELAAAAHAQGLVSKDSAVLKLRRRCALHFRIMTPVEAVLWLDTVPTCMDCVSPRTATEN